MRVEEKEEEQDDRRRERDKSLILVAHARDWSSTFGICVANDALPSWGNQRGNKTTEGMRMEMEKWE